MFLNVLFVDLWGLILVKIFPDYFVNGPPDQDEQVINVMCRVLQGLVGVLLIMFAYYLCKFWRQGQKKRAEANKVSKGLKKQKKTTMKGLKKSNNPPDCLDCPICLVDYTEDDIVIQLKCHKNHLFHRDCFENFMNNVLKDGVGSPKCPLCQQEIKFN